MFDFIFFIAWSLAGFWLLFCFIYGGFRLLQAARNASRFMNEGEEQ